MLFLPIVERELRAAARNWRTHYGRLVAGGAALLVSYSLIWALRQAVGGATAGAQMLATTSALVLTLSLFKGVNCTADCISSEKREDTLGLLFLTHLEGRDIVLGKLMAHSLRSLYLLLAILPILGIPILIGGVTGAELWKVSIALLNGLFLAVSIGLLVSSLARSQRTAYITAGAIVAVLAMALPAGAVLAQQYLRIPWLPLVLNVPSPMYALQMCFASSFGLSNNFFWTAILLQFSVSVASLLTACIALPHFWKIKAEASNGNDWRARATFGNPMQRAQRRLRLLAQNPIYWLNARDRFGALWPALFAVVTLAIAAFLILHYDIPKEPALVIMIAALGANDFSMRMRVGIIGSLRLGQDRQSGALEMILSTPLPVPEILRGQWKAIRQKLLWTYLPLLVLFGIGAHWVIPDAGGSVYLVWFFMLMSVGDFIAMGYVAMWKGMRLRNVQHASAGALLRVLLAPWAVWILVMALIHQSALLRPLLHSLEPHGEFALAVLVWMTSTCTAIYCARRNLLLHLREAATDRYSFEQRLSPLALLRRWSDSFLTFNLLRARRPPVLN